MGNIFCCPRLDNEADYHPSHFVELDVNFGRFEGIWSEEHSDWLYQCSFDSKYFTIKQTLKQFLQQHPEEFEASKFDDILKDWPKESTVVVEGMVEWVLLGIEDGFQILTEIPNHEFRIGEEAGEMVCGFYNFDNHQLLLCGYAFKEHKPYCIGSELYRLKFDPRENQIQCKTLTHHHDWSGALHMMRRPTEIDLYGAIEDCFNEQNIARIIVEYLYYFNLPTTTRYNWPDVDQKIQHEHLLPSELFDEYKVNTTELDPLLYGEEPC